MKYQPLVESEKVLMFPLHIKLGFVKQFVKVLNKDEVFKYIFLPLSKAKIEGGICMVLQSQELEEKE